MFKLLVAVLFVLASRALAFNITLGQVFESKDILNIPANLVPQQCQGQLQTAQKGVADCNDETVCLCKDDVVKNIQTAQQCMFEDIVRRNIKPADPRVGSNPLMSAYTKSCKDNNITVAATVNALAIPAFWEGSFEAILPLGGTVVTVGVGAMLGLFALLLLSNMS